MFVLTQVSILDAFIIFFVTLGPLNALGPFAQATRGADPAFRRTVAWRATAIATAIVIGVALVGSVTLETMARFRGCRGGVREHHHLLPVIANDHGTAGLRAAAPSASRG